MQSANFWKKLERPILALAPMAGFTDSAFRQICKEFGADVVYSEMASASALFFDSNKTLELLRFSAQERPYVVQLFGNNTEHFATAARLLNSLPEENLSMRLGSKVGPSDKSGDQGPTLVSSNYLFQRGRLLRPDGIDINFGCPAPKVFKTGAGCALMRDKKLAREIIAAVCENTNLPVSIKIRAGIKNDSALEFIKFVKDLPFAAVMVHGRTYENYFSGPADFALMEKIKEIIPEKIVLANGGINTPEDAVKILQAHPTLDGLGIARGALGRPFIFEEIKSVIPTEVEGSKKLDSSLSPRGGASLGMTNKYDFNNIRKIILQHAQLVWQEKKEPGIIELRKHLGWYVKGFAGASEMRQKLVRVKTLADIKKVLK